jgi:hypothetical protein
VSSRHLPEDQAEGASFLIGDNVIEAMQSLATDSPLARHCQNVQGIYCLTFKVRFTDEAANEHRSFESLLAQPAQFPF